MELEIQVARLPMLSMVVLALARRLSEVDWRPSETSKSLDSMFSVSFSKEGLIRSCIVVIKFLDEVVVFASFKRKATAQIPLRVCSRVPGRLVM